MTDKEKIRAEIERRYGENKADGYSDVCEELWDILSFIDSMQEEPVSEDLELTWEDIKLIDSLIDDVSLEETDTMEDLYQEVLKRFKNMKDESI